jgi:hypothetical protein
MLRSMIALAVAAVSAVPAAAQEARTGRVAGTVVSGSNGRAVAGVQIRFDSGERVVTDSRGRFEVDGLAWGERPVILVSSRCAITTATVVVSEADRREYHLTLPQEIAEMQREDMRARAEGIYMTADEIMATRARRMIDVVRRVAPQMVGAPGVQPGDVSPVRGRNRATASGVTEPVLVVDGAVLGRGDRILSDLAPGEVAAMEILKGAAGGWMYGSEGAGGVIRVWTKRGGAASAPVGPESCEVPGW